LGDLSLLKAYFLIDRSVLLCVVGLENPPPKKMKYAELIVPILIVLAIGAGIGLAGLGVYQLTTGSPIFAFSNSNTGGSTIGVSIPKGVGSTQGLNYVPVTVSVAKGGKVTWTNNDPVPHTVTSTSVPSGASSFDSGNMNQNATYTVTFTVDGTYQYKCTYHPWMHGTVTVTG
jgi:plastocyanin